MNDDRIGIYTDIDRERMRQEAKFGRQTAAHPSSMTDETRAAILVEEVGEAVKEVNEFRLGNRAGDGELRDELIQVAAVAVAWIEAIDTRSEYTD